MSRSIPRHAHWLLCALLPLAACQAASDAPAPATDAAGLMRRLDAEIGAAACEADAQCRSVAVGHKACGGPEGYRAYSLAAGREPRILALAREQSAAARREVEASGMASTCIAVTDPGAQCRAGRCVLRAEAGRTPLVRLAPAPPPAERWPAPAPDPLPSAPDAATRH